jgi:hypothetical protein
MISLLYGGITNHFIGHDLNYCNKLNNIGTIHNEYVIAMVGDKNIQAGLIKGKDSVCSNITGPIASFRLDEDIRLIMGGYNTNVNDFKKRGIQPPNVGSFTPVIGIDYEIYLYKSNNFEVVAHNLISLGITTHSIGVNF